MNLRSRPLPGIFLAFGLLVSGLAMAAAQASVPGGARDSIRVKDAREFVSALGSHRTIILAAGDYLLSTAYDLPSRADFLWQVQTRGKELVLLELQDLELRGEAGARILGDCPEAYILDFYKCRDLRIEGIDFVRVAGDAAQGREAEAGGLYLEDCRNFSFATSRVLGPNGYPLEIHGSRDIEVRDSSFEGAFFGGLFAVKSQGLRFETSVFRADRGANLAFLEETRDLVFSSCLFEGNEGEAFLGAYTDKVKPEGVRFESCTFRANRYAWFTEAGILPEVLAPVYEGGNSFGPDWAEVAVAPPREGPMPAPTGSIELVFDTTGLGLVHPAAWEVQDDPTARPEGQRVGLFSPDGQAMALFVPLGATGDLRASEALGVLLKKLEGETEVALELGPSPGAGEGDYSGRARTAAGKSGKAEAEIGVRVRLIKSRGAWYAFLAMALQSEALAPGSELEAIFSSFGPR